MLIKIDKSTKEALLLLNSKNKISLEGNILKVIDSEDDPEFQEYLKESIEKDNKNRKKRLEITKQIQSKNKELLQGEKENERVNAELIAALEEAENAKKDAILAKEEAEVAREQAEVAREQAEVAREEAELARTEAEISKAEAINAKNLAESDLEFMQKRSQFELIGSIVRVALWIIIGVGVATTLLYMGAIFFNKDTQIIGPAWSNLISILLTNAFSIVGTIMGVKYATDREKK
jgi:Fe2+ transport system protein B